MLKKIRDFFRSDISEVKKPFEQLHVFDEVEQKQCSECYCFIDFRARRCPYCTTVLIA